MSQVVSRNLMISTQYAQSLILGMTLQRETTNKTLWGQPIERYANQNFTKRQHFEQTLKGKGYMNVLLPMYRIERCEILDAEGVMSHVTTNT